MMNPLLRLLCATILIASALQPPVRAQEADPSDAFLQAYMAVQTADKLQGEGRLVDALRKFKLAGSLLDQIKQEHPNWQPLVVQYRSRKTSESIVKLEQRLSIEQPDALVVEPSFPPSSGAIEGPLPEDPGTGLAGPSVSVSGGSTPGPGDIMEMTPREMQDRMRQLQYDLNSAIREANNLRQERQQIASQLAATDAQLKETIGVLDKSKMDQTQLKAELEQVKDALKNAIATEAPREALEEELAALKDQLGRTQAERDFTLDQNEDLLARLAGTGNVLRRLGQERTSILAERDKALAGLAEASKARAEADRLLAENSGLIEKLAKAEGKIMALEGDAVNTGELTATRELLKDLREQLVVAKSQSKTYQDSITELQGRLTAAQKEIIQIKSGQSVTPAEKQKMAEENDLLRSIIKREMQEQARRSQAKNLVLEELGRLEVQSDVMMNQLDLLGQPVIKLTDEERTLFKDSELAEIDSLASASTTTPSPESAVRVEGVLETQKPSEPSKPATPVVEFDKTPAVPAQLEPVAREAREKFERGDYPGAESLYEKILAKEPNNIYALSNLGVVRFRSGRLKAAEITFKKAIAIDPEDAFSHSTLGIVYYRQGRYDDAVNALTKSIAINPQNPIAHNYLGITASQKGWQEAAEKELQSAIALNPNYADAHFNLAVIYAVQQPPVKELARRHYQKATELGAEGDSALERLIQ